jgi:hypothetical protein
VESCEEDNDCLGCIICGGISWIAEELSACEEGF